MKRKSIITIQSVLWLALVLALVGSLRHVAWGFSTLEQGDIIAGYIQAVAVDLGLFALALGIQSRRRQNRGVRMLWAGVLLFSAVSTYANLLHGLHFQTDLGLVGWGWLVSIRPVILSGVLPLLVVYLAEVAGDDVNHAAKVAEREARKAARADSEPTPHAVASKAYKCGQCEFTSAKQQGLAAHMRHAHRNGHATKAQPALESGSNDGIDCEVRCV